MKKSAVIISGLILLVMAAAYFLSPAISVAFERNSLALNALQAVVNKDPAGRPAAIARLEQRAGQDCWANWLLSQLTTGDSQQLALKGALKCSPDYLDLISNLQPTNTDLARQAAASQPLNPAAWMWLAAGQNLTDPKSALPSFYKVVELDPKEGHAWCQIGRINENLNDLVPARDAFLQCCANDDPGRNGCFGAGRTEEKLGNPGQAILYYQLSTWPAALQRAEELKKLLQP
jgi:hypothetical protein